MFSTSKTASHPQIPRYHSSSEGDFLRSAFGKPDHKRTQSDAQDFAPCAAQQTEKRTKKLPCHHQRSYSQNFDLGPISEDLQGKNAITVWEKRRKRTKSPTIVEMEEDDFSESEEVIRKILKEREISFARASTSRLDSTPHKTEDSIEGLQASMSHLLSRRMEDARKTDTARAKLKQEVMKLIQGQSLDASRGDSPETVIAVKTSQTSSTTVLELNDCGPDSQKFPEERKDGPNFEKSFSKGSEADNTVIADAEALLESDMSSSQVLSSASIKSSLLRFKPNNHKLIKNALGTICLAGEANRKAREEVIKLITTRKSINNFVIAFKGTLGRHELGALYEHDQSQGVLQKLYGPPTYPEHVTCALVQSCYRYDSSAREFRFLQNRRFAFGMDAVALHRRL